MQGKGSDFISLGQMLSDTSQNEPMHQQILSKTFQNMVTPTLTITKSLLHVRGLKQGAHIYTYRSVEDLGRLVAPTSFSFAKIRSKYSCRYASKVLMDVGSMSNIL